MIDDTRLGAVPLNGNRCSFRVWAPFRKDVRVHVVSPNDRLEPLRRDESGYHEGIVGGVVPAARYFYLLDGERERPDPASRFQPYGVHGPSQVVDPSFGWTDASWYGLQLQDYIMYELHVGTFTHEGTFNSAMSHLHELRNLGITAIELMPVAQFPGTGNWGYDGVYPFAVHNSYGGPDSLKRLVDTCHGMGIAVILDVVYNHLGPEGNYFADFGPYFTDRYVTPWGSALNFDGPLCKEVRSFFIENALHWLTEFHMDALRLDAVHCIHDSSQPHFLEELGTAVHERAELLNRNAYLIAESNRNDSRIIRSPKEKGYGMDAAWNDDFHHALHTLLTQEKTGYYQDFGRLSQLETAFREGFVFSGQYNTYRGRKHGNYAGDLPAHRFVVCCENHDQIGNRINGDRLTTNLTLEELKLAAGVVLLSPFVPLLFMGEEYGETAPFPYFVSFSDPDLTENVKRGRIHEFAQQQWNGVPPDPEEEGTYRSAKLNRDLRRLPRNQALLDFYKELIVVRTEIKALTGLLKESMDVSRDEGDKALVVRYHSGRGIAVCILHFNDTADRLCIRLEPGNWIQRLDSSQSRWSSPGSTIPAELTSDGAVSLTFGGKSVSVFTYQTGIAQGPSASQGA